MSDVQQKSKYTNKLNNLQQQQQNRVRSAQNLAKQQRAAGNY
jgi:hypothetical protein